MKLKDFKTNLIELKNELKKIENKKVTNKQNVKEIIQKIIENHCPKNTVKAKLNFLFSLLEKEKFFELFEEVKNSIDSNQEYNIIAQMDSLFALLISLHKANFLESCYYEKLDLNNIIKSRLNKTKLDNRGLVIWGLYSYLLLLKEFSLSDFKKTDDFINKNKLPNTSQKNKNSYADHLRNSIAHGNIEFFEYDKIRFTDINYKSKSTIIIELPLNKLGQLLVVLRKDTYSILGAITDLKY